ncbi:MAG: 2-oxo acid dehydrogenase subunit E2 [Ktedonobacteraceae bacterium]|nr:2-oxo acid dehydrogenase subunit E2 [Ktedonobacteraceae bacterium]
MQEFKLPDLGEGMEEAEIRHWLVKTGDTVRLDQPIVQVETDKAMVEIPAPVAGRIASICVQEGTVAKLGEVLVIFDTENGAASIPPSSTVQSNTSVPLKSTTPASPANFTSKAPQRILAAPAVRKRAFELDIELADVPSSHSTGRVTMDDIQAYIERAQKVSSVPALTTAMPSAVSETRHEQANGASKNPSMFPGRQESIEATEERQPLTGLRKRIAEHMERSWRTIPHAAAFDELDGSELVALRQTLKPLAEQRGVHLTYMPLLIKLLIPVLKEFPIFNASLDEERREIVYKRVFHIGIAADSPEGLLVPVMRNADQLTIIQIAEQLERLVEGAQKRTLSLSEVAGSTFTLNNIGSFGGSSGTPIINYPEVAILAVGRLQEKAVVQNGAIVARTVMPLVLSFDHRVIDGALAGRFLARFKALVEHPQQLILDMI